MWCTARRRTGTWLARLLGVAVLLTGGCGFHPLYKSGGGGDEAVLATVEVARIRDRVGQQLRNLLMENFAPRGPAGRTDYRLTVTLTESKSSLAIRKDETATRANLTITANFKLLALKDPRLGTFSGQSLSTNSYNILTSDFATLSAERDARYRALRTLAQEIRLRVAAAIANPGYFAPPPAPVTPAAGKRS